MPGRVPFLMYHELLAPGRRPARSGAGYARYVLADSVFREHLGVIEAAGAGGVGVGTILGEGDDMTAGLPAGSGAHVAITFDDGCASDLEVAAPVLRDAGFGATFFITVKHLDTPGFLASSQLRELAAAGFEIGSHGMTHAYLPDLEPETLRAEIADSKAALEDLTGRPVRHFSCPGGRWSDAVAAAARDAGYLSVCDSRPVANAAGADAWRLGRFPVTTSTTTADLRRIIGGRTPGSQRLRSLALGLARAVLGNRAYDRAREVFLERSGGR